MHKAPYLAKLLSGDIVLCQAVARAGGCNVAHITAETDVWI